MSVLTAPCGHNGNVIRRGAADSEEGAPEEAGRGAVPDGRAHRLGARGQGPLHRQPHVRRHQM